MKKATLYATRALTEAAVLAGLFMGMLNTLAAGFTCFDSCPSPAFFFSTLVTPTVWTVAPAVALEVLALAAFVAYCAVSRQHGRAAVALAVAVIGALAGAAMLAALMRQGQATLPLFPGEDILAEEPVVRWRELWGFAVTGAIVIWSGFLTFLLWRAE